MSKTKNGGLDQYGAEPFKQQQFGTAGTEGVKVILCAVSKVSRTVVWIWIWNVVDKLPMWGITSTNGDDELVQTTLEAVDGSRLSSFFVKFVPLGNCSGVERFLVCGCGCQDALELVLVVASGAWIRWDKRRSGVELLEILKTKNPHSCHCAY